MWVIFHTYIDIKNFSIVFPFTDPRLFIKASNIISVLQAGGALGQPYWSDHGQTVTELSNKSVVRKILNPVGRYSLSKKRNKYGFYFYFLKYILCGCLVSHNLFKKLFGGLRKENLIYSANSLSFIYFLVLLCSKCLLHLLPIKFRIAMFLDAYTLR